MKKNTSPLDLKHTNETPQKIALVLGAAGFIGRHVCREMSERGFIVYGIGHGQWTVEERSNFGVTHWMHSDISLESLRRVVDGTSPDVVLHCAGSGTVAHSYKAPASDFERSVSTTLAALEFCREQASKPCFVLTSSAAVYGDQGDMDIHEDAQLAPISPYGFHKVMAERLCESYHRFFNVTTRVVRLFSVYGEGLEKQLLWDAMNKFHRGDYTFFGTGEEMRDWIHIEDAARLMGMAATALTNNHTVYNGGHCKAQTNAILGALAQTKNLPSAPIFSGEVHNGNPRRLTASTMHAFEKLGFKGSIQLEDGLRRYADWFEKKAVVQP